MRNLANDCKEILVEYGFTQRWAEIEKYWELGKRINEEKDFPPEKVRNLSKRLKLEEEDVWNAIIFYKQYPDLSFLPSGKAVSWSRIKDEL